MVTFPSVSRPMRNTGALTSSNDIPQQIAPLVFPHPPNRWDVVTRIHQPRPRHARLLRHLRRGRLALQKDSPAHSRHRARARGASGQDLGGRRPSIVIGGKGTVVAGVSVRSLGEQTRERVRIIGARLARTAGTRHGYCAERSRRGSSGYHGGMKRSRGIKRSRSNS